MLNENDSCPRSGRLKDRAGGRDRDAGSRRRRFVALGAVVTVAATVAVTSGTANGASDGASLQRQMAEVRRATARFHNIAAAEAAGYINPGQQHCVEVPGLGGMGIHFVNPGLVRDGVLEPTKPEILLYAPSGEGLRLVGVEYLMPTSQWRGHGAPNLFGKPFDGPMPEHEQNTTGDHYDQHVWIWSHNPSGLFATWNREVQC
jgi:hypothetical protein